MTPERRPGFRLAAVAVALAAIVVVLGAWTRLADAGLGCPDWPGCYGFASVPGGGQVATAKARFPEASFEADKAWPEMIHRYAAGGLGVLVFALALRAVYQRRCGASGPLKLPLALAALVIGQAAFGAWTVTLKLWPQVVTAHLLGGVAMLALLFLLLLRLGRDTPPGRGAAAPTLRRRRPLALAAVLVVVGQIALGGWTSSNYAALACPDFPTCHGQWWPEANFARGFDVAQPVGPNYLGGRMEGPARTAIQLTHRLGALVVTGLVLALSVALVRAPARAGLSAHGWALAAALMVQLGLGIANVTLGLPLVVASAHNAGAAALLLILVSVNYRLMATTQETRSS